MARCRAPRPRSFKSFSVCNKANSCRSSAIVTCAFFISSECSPCFACVFLMFHVQSRQQDRHGRRGARRVPGAAGSGLAGVLGCLRASYDHCPACVCVWGACVQRLGRGALLTVWRRVRRVNFGGFGSSMDKVLGTAPCELSRGHCHCV